MSPPETDEIDLAQREGPLLTVFARLIPLVDRMANTLLTVIILGLFALLWVFVYMWHFHSINWYMAALVCVIVGAPIAMLCWYWSSLQTLKTLPETLSEAMDDTRSEVTAKVQGIRASSDVKKNRLSTVRSVWELGSVLGDLRDLAGSYVQVSSLVNPVVLALVVLSLCGVGLLNVSALVLAVIQVF